MRQGKNIALASPIFVMQLVAEEITYALKVINVEIINLKNDEVDGKMKLYDSKDNASVRTIEINLLVNVYDGSFLLKDRSELISVSRIEKEVMAKWGSIIQSGSSEKRLTLRFLMLQVMIKS